MKEITQYRLFPSYKSSISGRLADSAIMTLQFLDYSDNKPVWRSVPKYISHQPNDAFNSINLGDLLVAQEHREADSITSVCPPENPNDFRTRVLPLIEFPLEDDNFEAKEFIKLYPNIKHYLEDVLELFVDDSKDLMTACKVSDEQYKRTIDELLIKQAHRVTYL